MLGILGHGNPETSKTGGAPQDCLSQDMKRFGLPHAGHRGCGLSSVLAFGLSLQGKGKVRGRDAGIHAVRHAVMPQFVAQLLLEIVT